MWLLLLPNGEQLCEYPGRPRFVHELPTFVLHLFATLFLYLYTLSYMVHLTKHVIRSAGNSLDSIENKARKVQRNASYLPNPRVGRRANELGFNFQYAGKDTTPTHSWFRAQSAAMVSGALRTHRLYPNITTASST